MKEEPESNACSHEEIISEEVPNYHNFLFYKVRNYKILGLSNISALHLIPIYSNQNLDGGLVFAGFNTKLGKWMLYVTPIDDEEHGFTQIHEIALKEEPLGLCDSWLGDLLTLVVVFSKRMDFCNINALYKGEYVIEYSYSKKGSTFGVVARIQSRHEHVLYFVESREKNDKQNCKKFIREMRTFSNPPEVTNNQYALQSHIQCYSMAISNFKVVVSTDIGILMYGYFSRGAVNFIVPETRFRYGLVFDEHGNMIASSRNVDGPYVAHYIFPDGSPHERRLLISELAPSLLSYSWNSRLVAIAEDSREGKWNIGLYEIAYRINHS